MLAEVVADVGEPAVALGPRRAGTGAGRPRRGTVRGRRSGTTPRGRTPPVRGGRPRLLAPGERTRHAGDLTFLHGADDVATARATTAGAAP